MNCWRRSLASLDLVATGGYFWVMNVSIKEAKDKLSELVRQMEAGETAVITRGGKPAANDPLPEDFLITPLKLPPTRFLSSPARLMYANIFATTIQTGGFPFYPLIWEREGLIALAMGG